MWVENLAAPPQIPVETLPPSSSWSAEGEIMSTVKLHTFSRNLLTKISPNVLLKNIDRFDHCVCVCACACACVCVCVSDLVFTPQQAVVVVLDAGADEVHAVVLNSKVKISKPEHHPGSGGTRAERKR